MIGGPAAACRVPAALRGILGNAEGLAMAVSSVVGFGIRAVGVALMTIVTVAFTRRMGAEEYGRLAFLLSGGFIIVLFAGLGLPTAASRLVPRYLARGDHATAAHYLLAGLAAVTLTSLLGGGLFAAAILLLPSLLGAYRFPALGIAGLVVSISLMRFVSEASRAFGLQLTAFLAESVVVRLVLLAALGLFVLTGAALPAGAALALWVGAQALVALAVTARVLVHVAPGIGAMRLRRRRLYKAWLGVSLAMLVTPVYYFLLFETDIVTLGFLSGPYDVGLYQVARRLAELTVFCAGAASSVGLPRLARAHAEQRPDDLQNTIDVMNLIGVGSTGAVVIGLIGIGPFALQLFGPEFQRGYPTLMILALGRLAAVLLGPASDLLLMTGHHHRLGRVNLVFAVLNIALNLALIPWLGALGAAVATSTASVSWSAWLYLMARRLTPVETCAVGRVWRTRQGPGVAGA